MASGEDLAQPVFSMPMDIAASYMEINVKQIPTGIYLWQMVDAARIIQKGKLFVTK